MERLLLPSNSLHTKFPISNINFMGRNNPSRRIHLLHPNTSSHLTIVPNLRNLNSHSKRQHNKKRNHRIPNNSPSIHNANSNNCNKNKLANGTTKTSSNYANIITSTKKKPTCAMSITTTKNHARQTKTNATGTPTSATAETFPSRPGQS